MNEDQLYILRVDSPDKPGIVADVATCLVQQNFNIEDAAQFNDKFSGHFFMRILFRPMEGAADIDDFAKVFSDLANNYDMEWSIHPQDKPVRTLLMVSKADHCLNDILYRTRTGHLPLEITAVVSNHEDCRELAEQRQVPFKYLPVTPQNKAEQEQKLMALVRKTGSELVVLARYMQIMSADICAQFPGQMINIHHSFLPGFKGARPYHQAWERGVKIIGATAHFVTPDLDEGPIIAQETTPVDHAHTPEAMQVMGQDIEATVLARALRYYAERRIFLHGNRTVIL